MKLLNFGSLNIDYVYDVESFVKKGETISSSKLQVFSGGKGLNQSVALARAGVKVYHAGMIGEDGRFLLSILEEAGANTSYVEVNKDIRTGNAIIQRDMSGDNCILLFGGANRSIDRAFIDRVLEDFEEGDYLLIQNEISEISYIIDRAWEKGMKIILNPSPMDLTITKLKLDRVAYFLLNETEAQRMLDDRANNDPTTQAEELSKRFPNAGIVLTIGDKGCIYCDKKERLEEPAIKVDAVDTTAAGDTFTGYFVGALLEELPLDIALKRATVAASIAVSRMGAAPSIPYRKEVEEAMQK